MNLTALPLTIDQKKIEIWPIILKIWFLKAVV